MMRSYPNSIPDKTDSLRDRVADLMVAAHLIAPELADYHAERMSERDLLDRLQMYRGQAPRGFP